jgi:DNA-binding YbaB/EbfC family protein
MMAKGFQGGGMGNMNNMIKQAQKMQKDMMKVQEELEQRQIEASAGGGAITVVVTGKKELVSIKIKPEVVDPDDVELLQDLILAAVNEAIRQAEEMVSNEMGKLTGGLGLPGGMF